MGTLARSATPMVLPRLRAPARRLWRSALRLSPARYPIGTAALAGLYYGSARLGFAFGFSGPVAAIVWLPVGVAIAGLCLAGIRYWPGVLIGELLVNDYTELPLGAAFAQTVGNMLEVVAAAVAIRLLLRRGRPLDSVAGLGRVVLVLAGATAASATIGTGSLFLAGVVERAAVPSVWRTWWLGDVSGALLVVPLVLAWWRPPPPAWFRGRVLEAVVTLASVAVLGELALRSHQPLTYLVFPPMIWATLRFGQRGATVAITIAVGLAVWNTTHYFGPFSFASITHSVLSTQLFIAVSTLSTLALAAVVSEREALAAGLRASRARLVTAADVERRRIEHDLHDGAQQRLTALAYRLRADGERVGQAPEQAPELFAAAEAELERAIDELRELAHGIQPVRLAGGGLAAAFTMLAARSVVPVKVLAVPRGRINTAAETTAFYVAAEAMTNAQRYSRAELIWLHAAVWRGTLVVEVADDGVGGAAERAGSGLEGLRDRVEAVGGSFRLSSPLGDGTRVVASIPLARTPP